MANDTEVKTVVEESVHDDVLVMSRAMGFKNKAEYLRWLIHSHLYGAASQLQLNHIPGNVKGRDL